MRARLTPMIQQFNSICLEASNLPNSYQHKKLSLAYITNNKILDILTRKLLSHNALILPKKNLTL